MFKVNLEENRLIELDRPRFSDLNLYERDHLQEWLAKQPDALGEDLLIIQKEFDGFADTRERLDLLALDREGRLVVIENKLDDSGRDVVWQALKYAAYCSSLRKGQIIEIYQKYLDKHDAGEKAEENLCEFLGIEDLGETEMNPDGDQRLILIAAKFRKEVTATVLWLIEHDVRAQCFRAAPYREGETIFVDLQQIIPLPEAKDYMIEMMAKKSEERSARSSRSSLAQLRLKFWTQALEELVTRGFSEYAGMRPHQDSSMRSSKSGIPGCTYYMVFLKKEPLRVEIYLNRSTAGENKWIFDELKKSRREIEERFGARLKWQRLDARNASRISYQKSFESTNEENWPEMTEWFCEHIDKLEKAFAEPIKRVKAKLAKGGPGAAA